MKQGITLFLILICTFVLSAQNKQFTLDDVIAGGDNYRSFYPESLSQLKWLNHSDRYSYVKDQTLVLGDGRNGKEKNVINLSELNKLINETKKLPIIPSYAWYEDDVLGFWYKTDMLRFVAIDPFKKKLLFKLSIPSEAQNKDLHYASRQVAYTVDNNLYIATQWNAKIAVTSDADKRIINGQSVHQREFGITKGTFWSRNGKALAFYRMDETPVSPYPIVDYLGRKAEVKEVRYPMAGMPSHHVTLGVYHPSTGETTFLKTGEPKELFLCTIAWSKGDDRIFVGELNREQNHLKMQAYNASSGEFVKTLFEEKSDSYVEPQQPLVLVPGKDELYIWQSRKNGYNHLYLLDENGKQKRQLSKGKWEVTAFHGFSDDGKKCFVSTTINSPLERHPASIDINRGKLKVIIGSEGTHSSSFSYDGKFLLDTWSNTKTPRIIDLVDVKSGTRRKRLLEATNPYKDYHLGDVEVGSIKANDGMTDLYYRLIKPSNFDPQKKYPVIVYVYGGPHSQMVSNKWMAGARMWQHYMAQKGYIAFTLDNRGTSFRGADFETVIHRQLGVVEMQDQLTGVEFLKSKSYVDTARIGVHGWSYGGFMTTSLMTTYPGVFKVGVAGGPVIDWSFYEIMYGERYMDMPQENPEGYKNNSLLNKADKLEGRLLIIHGALDPVVLMQHSMAFVRKCVEAGKQLDYFVYPAHEHNVRGKDRVHLMEKVTRYFDDFLK